MKVLSLSGVVTEEIERIDMLLERKPAFVLCRVVSVRAAIPRRAYERRRRREFFFFQRTQVRISFDGYQYRRHACTGKCDGETPVVNTTTCDIATTFVPNTYEN
jgi:hypothetical protein